MKSLTQITLHRLLSQFQSNTVSLYYSPNSSSLAFDKKLENKVDNLRSKLSSSLQEKLDEVIASLYGEKESQVVFFDEEKEERFSFSLPIYSEVYYKEGPHLLPLLSLLCLGKKRGVVLLNNEHAKICQYENGNFYYLKHKELEIIDDWRETKAKRPTNISTGQAVSDSGRDHYEHRMKEEQKRFWKEIGEEVTQISQKEEWQEVLTFSEQETHQSFCQGYKSQVPVMHVDDHNLLSLSHDELQERVMDKIKENIYFDNSTLMKKALDFALQKKQKGSLGIIDTEYALDEGRVEKLFVLSDYYKNEEELERLVEKAVQTGSEVIVSEVKTNPDWQKDLQKNNSEKEIKTADDYLQEYSVLALWRYF